VAPVISVARPATCVMSSAGKVAEAAVSVVCYATGVMSPENSVSVPTAGVGTPAERLLTDIIFRHLAKNKA